MEQQLAISDIQGAYMSGIERYGGSRGGYGGGYGGGLARRQPPAARQLARLREAVIVAEAEADAQADVEIARSQAVTAVSAAALSEAAEVAQREAMLAAMHPEAAGRLRALALQHT